MRVHGAKSDGIGEQIGHAHIGGDAVLGIRIPDAALMFETDPLTEAIVILGEIGSSQEEELAQLSARTLHAMPHDAMQARLATLDADLGEPFWLAVRGNLATLADVADWAKVVRGPVTPQLEDVAFLAEAAASLPAEPWDEAMWKAWTSALAAESGRKGRALFHPLRLALTAREKGPEMAKLLPLIGRAKAEARLRGVAA